MDILTKNFQYYWSTSVKLFCSFTFFISLLFIHANSQNISFGNSALDLNGQLTLHQTLSVHFGPDGRLYVIQRDGTLYALNVVKNGANDYMVTAAETLLQIKNHPNHDDDGSSHSTLKREATSIIVKGTASNPIIYATSSDYRTGGPSGDPDLDTNSGVITRMTWNGSSWDVVDLVRGLPRSEENHATFGLEYTIIQGKPYLLVSQGGNTNAGSPCTNFAWLTEFALSAAVLIVDLDQINAMPILTDPVSTRNYIYDIPTLDDPTRANANGIEDPNNPAYDGIDLLDPWGGNDGLNQAKIVPNGPVQIFSPGYRNTFDLVVTQSGAVYVTENGANGGWGGFPENEGLGGNVTSNYRPGEPGSQTSDPQSGDGIVDNKDHLELVTTDIQNYTFGSYYGGHPNPIRANPAGAGLFARGSHSSDPGDSNGNGYTDDWFRTQILNVTDPNFQTQSLPVDWPPVPISMANPVEGDFRMPSGSNPDGPDDGNILVWQNNTNAIDEYTASNFSGAMQGNLIAGRQLGNLHRVTLNPDGTVNTYEQDWVSGLGGNALGIKCQGDGDIFPGTIWIATYDNRVVVLEPQDVVICLQPGDSNYDPNADYDQDGFTNQDEIDNGTDHCSGSSQPEDFDGDKISDLNDLDDDGDGINDDQDPFQMGQPFELPVDNELFSNQPDLQGYQGLGLTGLMNNGDPNPNYLDWLDDPTASNTDVDDIYGGAIGGMTIYHTTGDAFTNDQDKAYQYGINIDATNDTVVVAGRMLPPFHNHSSTESQGLFIGDGFQDNYVKIVLVNNQLNVVGENGGTPLTGLPSTSLPTINGNLDLRFIIDPVNGMVQAAYSLDDGNTEITFGSPFAAQGALLTAIQNQNTALAVGMIGTADVVDGFASNWDFVKCWEKNGALTEEVVFRVNAQGPTLAAIDNEIDWITDIGASLATDLFEVNTGIRYTNSATSWDPNTDPEIQNNTPFGIFDTERWDGGGSPEMKYTFNVGVPGDYTVRLFMRNGYSGTSTAGARIFDVTVEGNTYPELTDIDLSALFGHLVAGVFEVDVTTTDNLLEIEFFHQNDNPLVCGIEILRLVNASNNCDPAGTPCDDGNSATYNDVEDGNCGCSGTIPTVSIQSPLDGASVDSTFFLSFNVTNWNIQAGGDHIRYYVDGNYTGSAFNTQPIQFVDLDAGAHNIELRLAEANQNEIGVQDAINITVVNNNNSGGNETVLFRINSGGPLVSSNDNSPVDWAVDTKSSPSTYFVAGSNLTYSNIPSAFVNNTPYPNDVFFTERWDSKAGDNMRYEFPVSNGLYKVNLLFAEIYSGGQDPGYRVMGAIIDGDTLMTNFDAVVEAGFQTAIVKSFSVDVQDALLEVEIFRYAGSPAIKGVEIVQLSPAVVSDSWTLIPNNPDHIPRHENSMVMAGNHFYLFGGRESPQQMEIYDHVADAWSNGIFTPKPFNHFQAVEHQGLVWVICAFQDNSFPNETPETHIYIFDPAQAEWIQGSEIPVSRRRGGAGVVVYQDKFYIVGGNTDGHDGGYVAFFDEYDPQTNTWTSLADAPHARDHFHSALHGDKLYVSGGRLSGGPGGVFAPLVPEVDVYDFTTGTWSTLPVSSNLPTPRASASVVTYQDQIVVIGGEGNGQAYATVEALDPVSLSWSTLDSLNFRRHGTQAIVSGDGIYITSGSPLEGTGSQTNMEVYGVDNAFGIVSDASQLSGPDTVRFSSASTQSITLQVSNGNQAMYIRSLQISGTHASDFSIVSSQLDNILIHESGTFNVDIAFAPTQTGIREADLEVQYGKNSTLLIPIEFRPVAPNSVLFRVNAGGPQEGSHDSSPVPWSQDLSSSPSPYFVSGSNVTFSTNSALTNSTSYPTSLFKTERWDSSSGLPMKYSFGVSNGFYTVNLLFAEIYSGASSPGNRVFGVMLEGNTVLNNFDVTAIAGYETAHVESFQVEVTDGNLDIEFFHITNNPAIKGIEIVQASSPPMRWGKTDITSDEITPTVNLFPNPLKGEVNPILTVNGLESGPLTVKVYNSAGQMIYTESIDDISNSLTTKLPISPLAAGIYLVKVENGNWVKSLRIVVRPE